MFDSFNIYFLEIDKEQSALIHVSHRYRHLRVILSGLDNLILETFNAEKNLISEPFTDFVLTRVPYDFSCLYEQLRCSDPCGYFVVLAGSVEETLERYATRPLQLF